MHLRNFVTTHHLDVVPLSLLSLLLPRSLPKLLHLPSSTVYHPLSPLSALPNLNLSRVIFNHVDSQAKARCRGGGRAPSSAQRRERRGRRVSPYSHPLLCLCRSPIACPAPTTSSPDYSLTSTSCSRYVESDAGSAAASDASGAEEEDDDVEGDDDDDKAADNKKGTVLPCLRAQ